MNDDALTGRTGDELPPPARAIGDRVEADGGRDSETDLVRELACLVVPVMRLTEQSPSGTFVVTTASRALYVVDIPSPDAVPSVTRHNPYVSLIRDDAPLPKAGTFSFNAATGVGQVQWRKDDPAERDVPPDATYMGTYRSTSQVHFIARVKDRDHADRVTALLSAYLAHADGHDLHDRIDEHLLGRE